MSPKDLTDVEREAVIVSIERVAADLTKQVAVLQEFVAQLRPLFPELVHEPNGKEAGG